VILTSVEFDHADIYRDLDHVKESFRSLVALVPPDGPVVACIDHADVRDVTRSVPPARRIAYGLTTDDGWRVSQIASTPSETSFALSYRGHEEGRLRLRMVGTMNALNATAVYALCRELGIDPRAIHAALSAYRGPARRQELVGEQSGIAVIDDFAHHPTAVAATLAAVRDRFPGRRLRAVFEPRSNSSRRAVFQDAYAQALAKADGVVLSEVFAKQNDPLKPEEMLSTERLVASLRARGIGAWTAAGADEILPRLVETLEAGDVVVCMSNGAFGNLPRRLLEALSGRGAERVTV
jgi:UDP-N-acetylmuramate: L-alanyl-gamma-D-glutamyl-meso-diaminopimelate ligase